MKRFLFVLAVSIVALTAASCSKVSGSADAFVGRYMYTDSQFVTWGYDSRALSGEGAFQLTKISKNKVKMTGGWTTIGEIDGNTVVFKDDMQSDNAGYITYHFGIGTLTGGVLRFNYTGSGSLKYSNGIAYPWTCSGSVVATNIDYVN